MMITLMCSKSPWTLGIVENHHRINMDKLHDHVDGCEICRHYYNDSIFRILNRLTLLEDQAQSHAEAY